MSKYTSITISYLRDRLEFDPTKGEFRWRSSRYKGRVGMRAEVKSRDGYLSITLNRYPIPAHRIAWVFEHGEWPTGGIDHINGDRIDNRPKNLRVVSQLMNAQNRRLHNPASTSKMLGASWKAKIQRWRAQIRAGGRMIHLGYFDTAEAAHECYVEAKRRLHAGYVE
jgi:hypothetical protein